MKKISAFFIVISTLLILFSGAHASDTEVYIGVFGGGVFPSDMEVADTGPSAIALDDLDLENGFIVGAKIGLSPKKLSNYLNVELEYNYISGTDVEEQKFANVSGVDINVVADISINSVFLNFLLRYPKGKIHPYIGIAPGWSWFNFDDARLSATVAGLKLVTDARDDSADEFAFEFLAGAEFDFKNDLAFVLGYRYYYCEPELDDLELDIEYKAHIFTAGLNIKF